MSRSRQRLGMLVACAVVGALCLATAFLPSAARAAAPVPYAYVTTTEADGVGPDHVYAINTVSDQVAAAITVGAGPHGIASSPDGTFVYVADGESLLVVRTFTNEVVATIALDCWAWNLAVAPDGSRIYVVCPHAEAVKVIDANSRSLIATVSVPHPWDIAMSPTESKAYIGGGSVDVLNTASNTIVKSIPTSKGEAETLAVTPDGAHVYVAEYYGMSIISTASDSVVGEVAGIGESESIAIAADGGRAYVGELGGVAVVDLHENKLVKNIPTGYRGGDVALLPSGLKGYTSGWGLGSFDPITYSVGAKIQLPPGATENVAITPPITMAEEASSQSYPPEVTITSHPPKETADRTAEFQFAGIAGTRECSTNADGRTACIVGDDFAPALQYECSIDAGAWKACSSGDSFAPLQPGDHRFLVRGTLGGMTSAPASYSWTIDLPRACVLKWARARVSAFTNKSKARLVIRYKAYKPARVTVSYSLSGTRGALWLGTASSRFKTAGKYRRGERLTKAEVAKLRATMSMKVHFSIPQAPSNCTRYYTKRLTIPKKGVGQTVWFQSDSIFGPEAK